MARKADGGEELVGVVELAEVLGVSRYTIYSWIERDPTFPSPAVKRKHGSLWSKAQVTAWAKQSGRPRRRRHD